MPSPKFALKREHMANRQLDAVQQARNELAGALNDCPFIRGRLISVKLPGFNTYSVVTHKLGTPAAFMIVRHDYGGLEAGARPSEAADQSGIDPNNQIRITSTNTATVDLWFYPRASQTIDSTGQSP